MDHQPLSRRAILCVAGIVCFLIAGMFVGTYLARPTCPAAGTSGKAASLRGFLASAPAGPVTLTLTCTLSDHYSSEYPAQRPVPFQSRQVPIGQVHDMLQQEALANTNASYSVRLQDGEGNTIHGYAPLASTQGARLAELLQGGPRRLRLEIQNTHNSTRHVAIRRVLD